MTLSEKTHAYLEMLERGETLSAIDTFYHTDISQFENNNSRSTGKANLRLIEEKNLRGVTSLKITSRDVIVDEEKMISWGHMDVRFTPVKGKSMRLQEAFFLKWEDGLIKEQKFYYKEIVPQD